MDTYLRDLHELLAWVENELDRNETAQKSILTRDYSCEDDYYRDEDRLHQLSEDHGTLSAWWTEVNADRREIEVHPAYLVDIGDYYDEDRPACGGSSCDGTCEICDDARLAAQAEAYSRAAEWGELEDPGLGDEPLTKLGLDGAVIAPDDRPF